MGTQPDPLTLQLLKLKRQEVLAAASRRRAGNLAVLVAVDRQADVEIVVDFDTEATVLDQVGLSLDLAQLVHREIPVRTRGSLARQDPRSLELLISL